MHRPAYHVAAAVKPADPSRQHHGHRASYVRNYGTFSLAACGLALLICVAVVLRPPPPAALSVGHPMVSLARPEDARFAQHQDTVVSPVHSDEKAVVAPAVAPPFRPLVKGVNYFADFDLATVKPPTAAEEVTATGQPLFHYVDPALQTEFAIRYVSTKPRIAVVQDFLSAAECDAIIAAASKSMFRSQVAPTINSRDSSVQDVRTSSQAWLSANADPAKPIVQRVLKLVGFPPGSNEELQVLRYELTQKYDAHNDYFDPAMYGPQATNRALTFYLYLSDVEEGGETWFPRADGKPPTFDYTSCTHGLGVRPKRGMAVIFYDMKPNGELDPHSLHGSCPVKRGTKWGGTLWLRMPTPPKH